MSIEHNVRCTYNWAGVAIVAAAVLVGCGPATKDRSGKGEPAAPASPSVTRASDSSVTSRSAVRVLFIGTSLTAGLGLEPEQAYPALVQGKADSAGIPIVAVNAGVSGETSAGALNRIGWVMRSPADVVVLETGANDALRALPVSEARANIAAILDSIKARKPAAKVLLVQMEAPPNLGPTYTKAFHSMYGQLAKEKGVTLIPFLLDGVAGIATLNQADGLHPNVRGERIVAGNIWNSLRPALEAR